MACDDAGIDAQREYLRCLHPAYPLRVARRKLCGTSRLLRAGAAAVPTIPLFLEAP